jgi:hypothetical protein
MRVNAAVGLDAPDAAVHHKRRQQFQAGLTPVRIVGSTRLFIAAGCGIAVPVDTRCLIKLRIRPSRSNVTESVREVRWSMGSAVARMPSTDDGNRPNSRQRS